MFDKFYPPKEVSVYFITTPLQHPGNVRGKLAFHNLKMRKFMSVEVKWFNRSLLFRGTSLTLLPLFPFYSLKLHSLQNIDPQQSLFCVFSLRVSDNLNSASQCIIKMMLFKRLSFFTRFIKQCFGSNQHLPKVLNLNLS